jgi:3',5'-cyclic AMP phosphodiesterase CpdA
VEVAFTSDLHVDANPAAAAILAEALAARPADVFVLCGDVTHDLDALHETLARLSASAPHRLFVPGNHELWCDEGESSEDRYVRAIPALCRAAGWVPLHAETFLRSDVAFVGETGWYDYSFRNPAFDDRIGPEQYRAKRWGRLVWMDGVYCRWPWPGDADVLAYMVGRLRRKLREAPAARVVAVTHFLPFRELVTVRRRLPWDYLNAFMGAEALGRALVEDGRVVRALAGHTHVAGRARIGGLDAEVSPVGYPRERKEDLSSHIRRRLARFSLA